MSRKIIIILISLVLFFAIGYGIFLSYFQEVKTENTWAYHLEEKPIISYEDMKKSQEEIAIQDALKYNTALESENRELCDTIESAPEKSRCRDMIGAKLALKSANSELCETILDKEIQIRCSDSVLLLQAETFIDREKCSRISDENLRMRCSTFVDEKDFSLHMSSGTLDSSFCETLGSEIRDRCRSRIDTTSDSTTYQEALRARDITQCDAIKNLDLHAQCRDTILFERAIRESDKELCESITNSERMEYCRKSVSVRNDAGEYQAIVSTGDIRGCDRLISEVLQRQCHDVIIIAEVRKSQEINLCDNLYNTGFITNCHSLIRK